MTRRTGKIAYPVNLTENPNVPGVFYVYDADDDEICVIFGQTRETAQAITNAISAADTSERRHSLIAAE